MNSDAEFAGFHLEKMFGFLSHRATPGTIIHFTLWLFNIAMANGPFIDEPRSRLPAIDFSIRWNLFFKQLNGVTRAQAFTSFAQAHVRASFAQARNHVEN